MLVRGVWEWISAAMPSLPDLPYASTSLSNLTVTVAELLAILFFPLICWRNEEGNADVLPSEKRAKA